MDFSFVLAGRLRVEYEGGLPQIAGLEHNVKTPWRLDGERLSCTRAAQSSALCAAP